MKLSMLSVKRSLPVSSINRLIKQFSFELYLIKFDFRVTIKQINSIYPFIITSSHLEKTLEVQPMLKNSMPNTIKLLSLYFSFVILSTACVTTNPDFSEEALLEDGELLTGGEFTGGENTGGEISGGETNGGETSGGETSGGETSGGETNGGETNGGETNGGETSGGETSGGETSGGETNGGETNGGETNGGETNGGETNGGEIVIDTDRDGSSPPEDCDDDDPEISPSADELCDGVDNDCDERIDEGVLNACDQCGVPPNEVCDGLDNDCDGTNDEGVLNACGQCGAAPVEVCDGRDNDCDSQVDEDLLNACGQCGALPVEACDGRDNDCDGQTDEGLLNACGQCGNLPRDACDGLDNDCDGRIDEGLPLNACGRCGALPNEVCDGLDNDCDTQVDEALNAPCFTLKETITTNNSIVDLGSSITIVGDLNNDGIEDTVVRSERSDRVRLIAYSGQGSELWSVEGFDDFGSAISSGYYFNNSDLYLAINDPLNDRIVIYNDLGQPYIFISDLEGTVTSIATLKGSVRDTLVFGMPEVRTRGLIQRVRFNPDNPTVTGTVYSTYGQRNQFIGERIYAIGDIVGNIIDDLVITVATRGIFDEDRRTMIMDGSDGEIVQGTLIEFLGEVSNSSFAEDLTVGKFSQIFTESFVFGSPLSTNDFGDEVGAIYFLEGGVNGYTPGMTMYGNESYDLFGLSVETLPRPNSTTDVLVVGGDGILEYINFANNRQTSAVPVPMNDLTIGFGLAIAKEPSLDGTYQMWVSGLSDQNDESQIWILRAR
ncbi:MAG: hypothetical protein CMH49_08890 [Myxococcales bacterium]|nr:hypothetical protein [Myxococcales bacterium]